jgi:hypothetical protein
MNLGGFSNAQFTQGDLVVQQISAGHLNTRVKWI